MPEITPSRYLVQASWDDSAPHLTEKAKADLLSTFPAHTREARSKGSPSLGAGAIYPVDRKDVQIPPFQIPKHFPRGYALDVGWNKTAALWGAWDREADILYVYAEYYMGQREPSNHAAAIKARGEWIKGVIDPAARGRQQGDGRKLIAEYREAGLKITPALNAVEAGLIMVLERLMTGRLKIFSNLAHIWQEMAIYRRDENGAVVKKFDHLMDTLRYLVLNYRTYFTTEPFDQRLMAPSIAADSLAGI